MPGWSIYFAFFVNLQLPITWVSHERSITLVVVALVSPPLRRDWEEYFLHPSWSCSQSGLNVARRRPCHHHGTLRPRASTCPAVSNVLHTNSMAWSLPWQFPICWCKLYL